MDIELVIDGVRYKHSPKEDKPYCTVCPLADKCYDVSWIKDACYHLDAEEGTGKFIKA